MGTWSRIDKWLGCASIHLKLYLHAELEPGIHPATAFQQLLRSSKTSGAQ